MTDQWKYLYCIVECSKERTFKGVTPIGGADNGPVVTVNHGGLAAVVSSSPTAEYESTRSNMVGHHRVLEEIMQELTILPVRFATVARGPSPEQDIQRLLQRKEEEFTALLAEMSGRVELGLRVFWRDEKAIFEELLAENSTIRRLRDSLSGKPAEVVRFQGISLGEMVKKALEEKRNREAKDILSPLRLIAYRTRENEVLVDKTIANVAFLVDKSREEEFDRAVGALERTFFHRASFKYVGPVPPYNFVNIVVNWEEL